MADLVVQQMMTEGDARFTRTDEQIAFMDGAKVARAEAIGAGKLALTRYRAVKDD